MEHVKEVMAKPAVLLRSKLSESQIFNSNVIFFVTFDPQMWALIRRQDILPETIDSNSFLI